MKCCRWVGGCARRLLHAAIQAIDGTVGCLNGGDLALARGNQRRGLALAVLVAGADVVEGAQHAIFGTHGQHRPAADFSGEIAARRVDGRIGGQHLPRRAEQGGAFVAEGFAVAVERNGQRRRIGHRGVASGRSGGNGLGGGGMAARRAATCLGHFPEGGEKKRRDGGWQLPKKPVRHRDHRGLSISATIPTTMLVQKPASCG